MRKRSWEKRDSESWAIKKDGPIEFDSTLPGWGGPCKLSHAKARKDEVSKDECKADVSKEEVIKDATKHLGTKGRDELFTCQLTISRDCIGDDKITRHYVVVTGDGDDE